MEVNANFVAPQEQINFKPVYENINGHFNGSKYLLFSSCLRFKIQL